MKRRAVSMLMVSMMTSLGEPRNQTSLKCCGTSSHAALFQMGSVLLTQNRALKAGVTFHGETSLCFSTANIDLLPITGSVMGFPRSHVGFPASLSRAFPGSIQVWSRPALHRLEIPQALRYVEGFFFSQAKPESERRGGFLYAVVFVLCPKASPHAKAQPAGFRATTQLRRLTLSILA
jgi:hypothetical protein